MLHCIFRLFCNYSIINLFSATEGADSAPVSAPGTPSDEKAGQVGMGIWQYCLAKSEIKYLMLPQ